MSKLGSQWHGHGINTTKKELSVLSPQEEAKRLPGLFVSAFLWLLQAKQTTQLLNWLLKSQKVGFLGIKLKANAKGMLREAFWLLVC